MTYGGAEMRSLDDLPKSPPGSTWYLCPVDGCNWSHRELPLWNAAHLDSVEHVAEVLSHADPGLREWSDVVSSAVGNVTLANAKRMEGVVSEHFATHKEVDFLRTINRLRGLLAENGIESGKPAHNWDNTRRILVHMLDIPALESEPLPTWMEIIDTARRRTEAAKSRSAPAVTAAQVDAAARAAWDVDAPMTNEGRQQFDRIVPAAQETWRERVRAAFRAVGIAVKP